MRTTRPGRDLLGDQRRGGVGDVAVDLDAAVHRPRVHDELARAHARGRDAVALRVLAQARARRPRRQHPLALHAQRRRRRRRGDRRRCRARPRRRLPRRSRGISVGRADERDAHAAAREARWMFERATRECSTSPTIATCRPSSWPSRLADRVEVEQRLRRVLVLAVAGVDDRARVYRVTKRGGADLRVADHERRRARTRRASGSCPSATRPCRSSCRRP